MTLSGADGGEHGGSRRTGDLVEIPGDYQFRARTQGHVIQRFWHAEKERVIGAYARPQPGERVLDVGCGSGNITDVLASYGAHAIGVDGNEAAVEFARRQFLRDGLEYHRGMVDELSFDDGSIDRIYCMEVVEHLYESQLSPLLRRFHQLLRAHGTLLLTTPNYSGLWPLVEKGLDAFRLVPRLQEEQHVSRFNRQGLRNALESAGFVITRLSTFATIAPFLSPLSWRLGRRFAALEDRLALPFGNILLAVARRP